MNVNIRGIDFAVELPTFGLREELVFAWSESSKAQNNTAILRVYSAALALCVPEITRSTRANRAAAVRDLHSFGEGIYSDLRERQKWEIADIIAGGQSLLEQIAGELWPSKDDVEAAAKNSEAGAPA